MRFSPQYSIRKSAFLFASAHACCALRPVHIAWRDGYDLASSEHAASFAGDMEDTQSEFICKETKEA